MKNVLFLTSNCVALCAFILGTSAYAQPPSNDDFDSATIVVEPLPFNDNIDTSEATTAVDDPDCVGNGPTAWYAYTPFADSFVTANTFGSNYDTTLSVYSGSRGSLIQIACNDDFGGLQSRVDWEAQAGETYYLMVGAFASGPGGMLNFTVEEADPPLFSGVTINSATFTPKSGVATVDLTATFEEPVFVFFMDFELIQRSGQGSIVGQVFKELFEFTDALNIVVPFSDLFGAKGYVGGPAELCVNAAYDEPPLGFVVRKRCVDVRLKGGK